MPYIELTTNVQVPDAKALILLLSHFGAEILKKPEEYVSAQYIYNDTLTFGGNHDPAFLLRIVNRKTGPDDENEEYSQKFSKWLKEHLDLSDNRGYILFQDPAISNVGYNGTTFKAIFAKQS